MIIATLAREASGRRVDVIDPDRSLLLLKPTGQVPHEGGQRFAAGSWEYRVIRAWIADGARRDPSRAAVERIEIRPADRRTSSVRAAPAGSRSSPGSPTATKPTLPPFCDLRVRDDRRRRGLEHGGKSAASGPATRPSWRPTTAGSPRHGCSVPTGRAVTVPDVPAGDIIDREVLPSSEPWASRRRGRRPTPSSSAGSRST